MADQSLIEWTDATWNPITGCSVVSPGCTNCYAMKLAGTRLKHHESRIGLTRDSKAGPVWNGEVRLNEQWLDQPLRWARPRRIFVCAHGDLFAENVPDEWIDRVFAVMALAPQHTFQVLTKRAHRMREYVFPAPSATGTSMQDRLWKLYHAMGGQHPTAWPLPNVWLGVSAEDQQRADERIPDLLATPAATRFISAEPLLGSLDMTSIRHPIPGWPNATVNALRGLIKDDGTWTRIDWVIVGGESGRGARPMHPAWVRSLRDQCAAAGTAFFFKQWGLWADINQSEAADNAGWEARGKWMILDRNGEMDIPDHRWPDEEAGEVAVVDVGKKAAGRLLDGIEHNAMPQPQES